MKSGEFIIRHDDNHWEFRRIVNIIVRFVSLLVAVPFFILLHRYLPNPHWPFQLDRIILAVISVAVVLSIFHLMRNLVLIAFMGTLMWLGYGQISGQYCFDNLLEDYRALLYSLRDNPNPEEYLAANFVPFPNKALIKEAIDFNNPTVRNFALLATANNFRRYQHHKKYRVIIQSFAIFKEINSRWNYVNDPKSREYFARASESILHLSGDCDDHSILMAACIKSIGGTPRLIYTTKHIYPELLIGDWKDLEDLNYILREKLFKYEIGDESIHYHIDEHDRIWLNLDYTAEYPGGKFFKEEILGVLNLEE